MKSVVLGLIRAGVFGLILCCATAAMAAQGEAEDADKVFGTPTTAEVAQRMPQDADKVLTLPDQARGEPQDADKVLMSLPVTETPQFEPIPAPIAPPPFEPFDAKKIAATTPDLAAIRSVHDELKATMPLMENPKLWDTELDVKDILAFLHKAWDGLDRYRAAGVLGLMKDDVQGTTTQERAVLLADYANWVSIVKNPNWEEDTCTTVCPIAVMEKALALDPNLPDGWRWMGNLHRARLCKTDNMKDKEVRTHQVLDAYAAYLAHGGVADKDITEFQNLNITKMPEDVCEFYLPYLEKGRTAEIMVYAYHPSGRLDISNSGKPENFDTVWDFKTAHFKIMSDNPKTNFFSDKMVLARVNMLEFRGKYYLVYMDDIGMPTIVLANKGKVCTYSRKFVSDLGVNKSPAVCEMLQQNKLPKPVKTEKVTKAEAGKPLTFPINDMVYSLQPWHAAEKLTVDLDNSGTAQDLIVMKYSSKAARGCEASWLAYPGETGGLNLDDRAMLLLRVQEGFEDCRGGSFVPFVQDGVTYIRADLGMPEKGETGNKHVLKMGRARPDAPVKIETVCSLWRQPSYQIKDNWAGKMGLRGGN